MGRGSDLKPRGPISAQHAKALSEAQKKRFQDLEQRQHLSEKLSGGKPPTGAGMRNWSGAARNDRYEFLLTAGYRREFQVQVGPKRGQHLNLDFAHPEAKINIEIDGPYHVTMKLDRDDVLRTLGWKIIRIQED